MMRAFVYIVPAVRELKQSEQTQGDAFGLPTVYCRVCLAHATSHQHALSTTPQQVEGCDTFEGFLMLQSMAGGTGAGAGTHLAEALVDDYHNAHVLNCCVW